MRNLIKEKKRRNFDLNRIIAIIVFITLIFSVGYAFASLIRAPNSAPIGSNESVKIKSDYALMLLQCILGLLVLFLPDLLNHKLSLRLPHYIDTLYYIFLYCAIYLGEVKDFYNLFDNWDTVLHAFSGIMLGCVGFFLVSILNNAENVKLHLSPVFIALFAFCFALAADTLWEIYEYTGDHLFGLNMQKFRLSNGTELIGHYALMDTMEDLIIDALSAGVVALIGYGWLKGKRLFDLLKNKKAKKDQECSTNDMLKTCSKSNNR